MALVKVFGLIIAFATLAASRPEGRITNGTDAIKGIAPYLVSIQKKAGGTYPHTCGGAILDEHWILTAAHCLYSEDMSDLVVKAGRYNLRVDEPTSQERSIDYHKNHELYTGGPVPYDIALIYTKVPFVWTKSVQPIALPEKDALPTGLAKIFGWGLTWNQANKIRFPEVLQTADLPLISLEECRKKYTSEAVHETNVCTESTQKGITVCSSDSGGPLVQSSSGHGTVVIGVVSWGLAQCGKPNTASVYVRVSAFVDWIDRVKSDFKSQSLNGAK